MEINNTVIPDTKKYFTVDEGKVDQRRYDN